MPATLTLTRKSIGMELRGGTFDILVDGKRVESIEPHETTNTPVEPGRHTLRVQKGRYASRELTFDTADGDVVAFRCSGAKIWPLWLATFVMPSMALSLSPE